MSLSTHAVLGQVHLKQIAAFHGAASCPTDKQAIRGLSTWRATRVLSYIEDNLTSRILVVHLARHVGLSHGHLMRAFKVRFGITLRVYINYRRIVIAQRRMMLTDESLCEIALECGMCDQAHFNRVFRRFVGLTPSRWRELQLEAYSNAL